MTFTFLIILHEAAIILLVYWYFKRRVRRISELSEARLCYIRILCEQIYTYSHAPGTLLTNLKEEMTIKKLLAYHVIENRCEKYFGPKSKINKKDQLFYMLHKEGFQPKELCTIFELNNLNSVYVKCTRINKECNFTPPPQSVEKNIISPSRR